MRDPSRDIRIAPAAASAQRREAARHSTDLDMSPGHGNYATGGGHCHAAMAARQHRRQLPQHARGRQRVAPCGGAAAGNPVPARTRQPHFAPSRSAPTPARSLLPTGFLGNLWRILEGIGGQGQGHEDGWCGDGKGPRLL